MNDYEQSAWDDIYYFCSSMPCQNKTHLKADIHFPNSNDFLIYKKVNNFFENSFSKNLLTPTTGYGYFQSITFKKQSVSSFCGSGSVLNNLKKIIETMTHIVSKKWVTKKDLTRIF